MDPISVEPFSAHPLAKHTGWLRAADSRMHHWAKPRKVSVMHRYRDDTARNLFDASVALGALLYAVRGLKFLFVEGDFLLRYTQGDVLRVQHSLTSYIDHEQMVSELHQQELQYGCDRIHVRANELMQMPCVTYVELRRTFTLQRFTPQQTIVQVGHH